MVVLHVDDDADDRELFLDAIKEISPSIICLTAGDGIEAQELWDRNPNALHLDFIFLDINMPKMNGLELLEVIRTHNRFKHVPVYFLSTSSNESEISMITSLGAGYLPKQANFERIVADLSSIIFPQKKVSEPIRLIPKVDADLTNGRRIKQF
ncbi:MAG: response regulator [Bacteroidota bacterium]